eukprot:1129016-Amphidinium_carterae.1
MSPTGLAVAHGWGNVRGSSNGSFDVALVPQICTLLFHDDNLSNFRCEACRKTRDIASGRRCATIRMGSVGSIWAKPPSTQ